jgi:hypothetical protein
MTKWTYRILMTVLSANVVLGLWIVGSRQPEPTQCINGIIMVPDRGGDMWVQRGMWPTHCIMVDKD